MHDFSFLFMDVFTQVNFFYIVYYFKIPRLKKKKTQNIVSIKKPFPFLQNNTSKRKQHKYNPLETHILLNKALHCFTRLPEVRNEVNHLHAQLSNLHSQNMD